MRHDQTQFGRWRFSAIALACAALGTLAGVPQAGGAPVPDPSFGIGGFTIFDEPGAVSEQLQDVVVLPDGKILGAGSRGGSSGFLLARLGPNGLLDSSFGGDGIRIEPDEGAIGDSRGISGIALRPDGRLVAGGLGRGGTNAIQVARYLSSGDLDTSFSGDGMTTVEVAPSGTARDVALSPDGSVVAVGHNGPGKQVVVAKLLEDGSFDVGFDPLGYILVDVPGSISEGAETVTVLDDGTILAGGHSANGALLVELNSDGEPVPGFGSGGISTQDTGSGEGPSGTILDMHVLDDGRILAAGRSATPDSESQGFVARFTASGDLDPSFGTGGVVRVKQTENADEFRAIELLPDGRILAAGRRNGGPAESGETWLLRLSGDGQPDPGFGPNGLLVADLAAGTDGASGLALQPDGRAVIAGSASEGEGTSGLKLLFARFAEQAAPAPLVLPPPTGPPPQQRFRCKGRIATIVGTGDRDRLVGTGRRDVIVGFGGNDRILARGGNDVVCAGAGRDVVKGQRGRDLLIGNAGPDLLRGGPARDKLLGNRGNDRLFGGKGRRDICNGGAGKRDRAARSCERRRRIP